MPGLGCLGVLNWNFLEAIASHEPGLSLTRSVTHSVSQSQLANYILKASQVLQLQVLF